MSFTPRSWFDKYVVKAADLVDLETRVTDYADSILGVINASSIGIAPGNSAAVNKSAFDAAMTGVLASGGALFADWTGDVNIDVSGGPIVPPDGVSIVFRGRKTRIKCSNPGAVDVIAFKPGSGVTFTLYDGTLEGPTTLTGTSIATGIQNDATTGTIRIVNCAIQKFTYCVRRSPAAVASTNLDILDSDLAGYGATYASTCVLWTNLAPGGGTGYLRIQGGSIMNWGDPAASGLNHGMYVGRDTDLLVNNMRFGASAFASDHGYGIQIYDSGSFATTNANASRNRVIEGCVFLDGTSGVSGGIVAGGLSQGLTKIANCSFLNRGIAINGDGPHSVVNCSFTGFAATSSECIFAAAGCIGRYASCLFSHGAGDYTAAITDVSASLFFEDCTFIVNSGSTGLLSLQSPSDATSQVVFVNCLFGGATAHQIIRLDRVVKVVVRDCTANTDCTGGAFVYVVTNGTGKNLTLWHNDISLAGGLAYFADSTNPDTFAVAQNFGSTGYKTEAGGVSTSTPGAVTTVNIAHGLALTPTKFSVQANNTNARGAPLYSVTADATNVILTFASALAGATSYAWNWRAEYSV